MLSSVYVFFVFFFFILIYVWTTWELFTTRIEELSQYTCIESINGFCTSNNTGIKLRMSDQDVI